MPHLYHPSFKFFMKPLPSDGAAERLKKVLGILFNGNDPEKQNRGRKLMDEILRSAGPAALRWVVSDDIGIPSRPFRVYRRAANYTGLTQTIVDSQSINGTADIPMGSYVCIVAAQVTPTAGHLMTVVALDGDGDGDEIPASTALYAAAGTYLFRAPGIMSLRVSGTGTIQHVVIIRTLTLINADGWQHVQTVGLPVDKSPTAAYAQEPQGWVPDYLVAPTEATRLRMAVSQVFYDAPPALPADLSPVQWPSPQPQPYLDYLDNLLESIMKMLDTSAFPFSQQLYTEEQSVSGLRQAGTPVPAQDATVEVPVLGTVLLSAITESDASLALGFGTIEFLPHGTQTGNISHVANIQGKAAEVQSAVVTNTLPPDYMVVADYDHSLIGPMSWATLVQAPPPVETPPYVDADKGPVQRPLEQDDVAAQTITLAWPISTFPVGNALLVSPKHGMGVLANNTVKLDDGMNVPLAFNAQSGQLVGGVWMPSPVAHYVLPEVPLPKSGGASYRFFIAARDVFAAWSAFREKSLHLDALPPQMPGLLGVHLEQDNSRSISGAIVPVKLTIEFSWDWEDRTPGQIFLAGGYYNPASSPTPPLINNTFSVKPAPLAADGFVVIDFHTDASGKKNPAQPFIVSSSVSNGASAAIVKLVDPPTEHWRFRYRCIFTTATGNPAGVTASFATLHKVGFSAAAAATELGRADLSAWTAPLKDILIDPRAPETPVLPEDIQLTALPDATRLARGVLQWPAIAGAAGYNVWEANETALLEIIGSPGPPAGSTLQVRATFLRTLINTHEAKSLKAFTRLNTALLPATPNPKTELSLPGATDKLYVYRVSAVNERNVEGAKSGIVFFAVPQVITPPIPVITAKAVATGIELTLTTPTGAAPAGYNVHRVRKYLPSEDIGLKGPAVVTPVSAGWTDTNIALTGSTVLRPAKRRIDTDVAVSPSWKPIYYQATAAGAEDLLNGKRSGLSKASRSVEMYYPPASAPVITLIAASSNAFSTLVRFSALLPLTELPLGTATIEIATTIVDPVTKLTKRTVEAFVKTSEIPLLPPPGTMSLALSAAPDAPTEWGYSLIGGTLPQFSVLIHHTIGSGSGLITVTDPLGRRGEHSF